MGMAIDTRDAMEDRALAETRHLLTQWGIWVRSGGASIQGLGKTVAGESATLTDAQALRVDRAVGQLWRRRKLVGRAVKMYYLSSHCSHRMLGSSLRMDSRSARTLLAAGEHWVDAWLQAHP